MCYGSGTKHIATILHKWVLGVLPNLPVLLRHFYPSHRTCIRVCMCVCLQAHFAVLQEVKYPSAMNVCPPPCRLGFHCWVLAPPNLAKKNLLKTSPLWRKAPPCAPNVRLGRSLALPATSHTHHLEGSFVIVWTPARPSPKILDFSS